LIGHRNRPGGPCSWDVESRFRYRRRTESQGPGREENQFPRFQNPGHPSATSKAMIAKTTGTSISVNPLTCCRMRVRPSSRLVPESFARRQSWAVFGHCTASARSASSAFDLFFRSDGLKRSPPYAPKRVFGLVSCAGRRASRCGVNRLLIRLDLCTARQTGRAWVEKSAGMSSAMMRSGMELPAPS